MKRTILFCLFSMIGLHALAQTVENVSVNGNPVDKFVTGITVTGDSVVLGYGDGTADKVDMNKVSVGLVYQVTLGGTESDAQSNANVLDNFGGRTVGVSVARSLYADRWNAICLPFDMTADAIESLFGKGTVVAAFDNSANGNVNFTTQPSVVAGVPYIIRPATSVDAFFIDSVGLKKLTQAAQYTGSEWAFVGTIAPEQPTGNIKVIANVNKEKTRSMGDLSNNSKSIADGNNTGTLESATAVAPLSAYLKGIVDGAEASTFSVDGDVTGILRVVDGRVGIAVKGVYSLAGKYFGESIDGLQSGVYIVNGKKQVVK